MNYTQEDKLLSQAKIQMFANPALRFFANLVCSIPHHWSEEIETLQTNGKTLNINPEFFKSLSVKERVGILAHESMHIAYMHPFRLNNRNPQQFNKACDYVINNQLKAYNVNLPEGGLLNQEYNNLTAEEIYVLLEERQDDSENPFPDLNFNLGLGEDELTQAEQEVQQTVMQAAIATESQGHGDTVPEHIKRLAEKLNKPLVDWKTQLRRFLKSLAKSDYTWRKPNKRLLPMYLPSLYSNNGLIKLTFSIDTSGSVSQKMFSQFMSEVSNVLKSLKPKEIELVQFDHEIKSVEHITKYKDLNKIELLGGGGTEVEPVIKQFMQSNSKALIILTDGYFNTDLPNPKRPVIWAVYNNRHFTPPFGQVIHVNLK